MKQSESVLASLPEDIILEIASYLQVGDLCALGSCSRFWMDLCGSNFLWESLTRQRWPSLDVLTESSSVDHGESSSLKGWRDFYVKGHAEMAKRAMSVVQCAEECSPGPRLLEIDKYLKTIEHLNSMQLGFKDVEMFLLRPEMNEVLNMVGLHYCRHWLKVPAGHVMEALRKSKISKRQVSVECWKVYRTLHGIRLRDGFSRLVSLQDLALPQEDKVLTKLHSTLPSMGSFISRVQYYIVLALPGLPVTYKSVIANGIDTGMLFL